MKTIERLRELLGKCKFGVTKATCEEGDMEVGCPDRFDVVAENGDAIATMMCSEYGECDDGSALLSESLNALPALLAVVEAAADVRECGNQWIKIRKQGNKEDMEAADRVCSAAEAKLDDALRALEGNA